jgi:beta-N-acetylhexosaminidase
MSQPFLRSSLYVEYAEIVSGLLGHIRICSLVLCVLLSTASEPVRARDTQSTEQIKRSIGQMIITGFLGDDITAPDFQRVINNLQSGTIGGVLFLPQNIASREQLKSMIQAVRTCLCPGVPLIAVDEEGGIVERLGEQLGFDQTPSAEDIAHDGIAAAKVEYRQVAKKLFDLGFNLNLAPVVDLNINPGNPIIGLRGRSYSSDPAVVTRFARTFILEHHALGILTSLKHYPGHGSSVTDTHITDADVSQTWQKMELYPYQVLIRSRLVDTIMVGHLRNNVRWGGVASQEGFAIKRLLRKKLKFDGVTISDDLGMNAVSIRTNHSVETAITSAIKTGIDIVVIAHPINDDTGRYVNASIIDGLDSGTLSKKEINKSLRRIAKLKRKLFRLQKSPELASWQAIH